MSRPTRFSGVALAALAAGSLAAHAHHPGGVGNSGGAGPINTISASTLEQGQTVAGVTLDYTSFKTLPDKVLIAAAAAGVDGVHGLRSVASYSLSAAYGVTNDLMISARLPYVRRTGISAGEADPITGIIGVSDHGGSSGLGDLTLLGQYRFFNDRANRFEAAVLLGLITPTGATNRRSRQGELLDAEFQPGSGAVNGLFGLALTKRAGAWSFDTNVLYVRASEGRQQTNLGDQLLYNAAVSYRLTGLATRPAGPMFHGSVPHAHGDDGHGHTQAAPGPVGSGLDLVLELNGEWHDRQRVAGVKDSNSGGNTVFLAPGLRLSRDRWSAFVSVGVPVVKSENGQQPEPEWRIRSGLAVAF